jgi:RNA polymerase sigma-70 factor (ECF subfamily)
MGQVVAFTHRKMVDKAAVEEQTNQSSLADTERQWVALLPRIAAGEQAALAAFYDATNSIVFGLALRILGERAAAEDAVVEVYAQIWAQAKTYDPQRGTLLSWLITLARSRALDLRRSRNRLQKTEPLETAGNVPSATPTPEDTSVAVQRYRLVHRALENLSEDQRQVIELAYFSDLSHCEIAEKLGQPLGTVKTRIRLGMIRLRELLSTLAPPTPLLEKESAL